MTHPEATPTRVTDFKNIEKITTAILPTSTSLMQNQHKNDIDGITMNVPSAETSFIPNIRKGFDRDITSPCNCSEIKTLLKIKVTGNSDDLTITCDGAKTAESIADLVDGYCRIGNNMETTFWDRIRSSTCIVNDSIDKNNSHPMTQRELTRPSEYQQPSDISQILNPPFENLNAGNCKFLMIPNISDYILFHSLRIVYSGETNALETNVDVENLKSKLPTVNEDYVDIGLGEEEEGKEKP